MDILAIINQLLSVLPIVLIMTLATIGMSYVFYVLYKKRGGKRKITIRQFVAIILLIGWLVVVIGLTTLSRPAFFEGWANLQLFSDYVNTWHQWSLSEFQLIIFNMLMFAPLGFLLPLVSKKIRRFGAVLGLSFIVTLGIELLQMFTHRGIFELNDILHNTLGSISGYLLMNTILESYQHRKVTVKSVLKALYIPMFFVLLFSGALIVYHTKELGNLSIRPAVAQNMKQVDIELNVELPTNTESVALYQNDKIHNVKYGKEIAALIESSFNMQKKGRMQIEGFNRQWSYTDVDGNKYILNYTLNDGGWNFYRADYQSETMKPEELEKFRPYFEDWLRSKDLLPSEAVFSTQNEDTIRWDMEQSIQDILHGQADYAEGFIMIIPTKAGQIPIDLFFAMNENVYVHEVEIISPAQAFDAVLKGNFVIFNDLEKGDQLHVNDYELDYVYDSKGYYQPVYRFKGLLNEEPWEALIPAI